MRKYFFKFQYFFLPITSVSTWAKIPISSWVCYKHCLSLKKSLQFVIFLPFPISNLASKYECCGLLMCSALGIFSFFKKEVLGTKDWSFNYCCEHTWENVSKHSVWSERKASLTHLIWYVSVHKRQPSDSHLKREWYVVLRCCITYRSVDLYEW